MTRREEIILEESRITAEYIMAIPVNELQSELRDLLMQNWNSINKRLKEEGIG